jgi:hypothetical protein
VRVLFPARTALMEFWPFQCKRRDLTRVLLFPGDDLLSVHDINAYRGKVDNKFILIFQKIRDAFMKARARYYRSFIPNSIKSLRTPDAGGAEKRFLNSFLRYGHRCWGSEVAYYPFQRFLKTGRNCPSEKRCANDSDA